MQKGYKDFKSAEMSTNKCRYDAQNVLHLHDILIIICKKVTKTSKVQKCQPISVDMVKS